VIVCVYMCVCLCVMERVDQLQVVEREKELVEDVKESVLTIIWAAPRCSDVQEVFTKKIAVPKKEPTNTQKCPTYT